MCCLGKQAAGEAHAATLSPHRPGPGRTHGLRTRPKAHPLYRRLKAIGNREADHVTPSWDVGVVDVAHPSRVSPPVAKGGAVSIRITPAVSAVITAKPSIIVGETRYVAAAADAALRDWRLAYLVERVRRFALDVLGLADASPPLPRLYSSPEAYLQTIGEAVQRTLVGAISFQKLYATMERGLPVSRLISFELAHSALAPTTTMATCLSLAF